jgi:short subunit dehydrogenase-like uncharacterized protein
MATLSQLPTKPFTHPVVVYGATGYTGQLACEFLGKLGVPFTASGRNQGKLDELAKKWQAQGFECTARATQHTVAGITELLKDAKVIINISGPFMLLGETVIQGALAANCHYLDSTGEQDFMLDMRRLHGAKFKAKNLVLSPSVAFLFGLGTLAADVCLESPGITDLEIVYAPPSLQTMASLQSMWRTTIRDNYSIVKGKLFKLPTADMSKKKLPDGSTRNAMRIGTSEPTFLMDDPRVQNCEAHFASDALARAVPMFRLWKLMNAFISTDTLDRWSDKLVETFKKNPEREEPESGKFVVVTTGTGPGGKVQVVMNGTSPYMLTGFLCAVGAQTLMQGTQHAAGYTSLSKAFGTDYMIKRLEEAGTFTTVHKQVAAGGSTAGVRRAS